MGRSANLKALIKNREGSAFTYILMDRFREPLPGATAYLSTVTQYLRRIDICPLAFLLLVMAVYIGPYWQRAIGVPELIPNVTITSLERLVAWLRGRSSQSRDR